MLPGVGNHSRFALLDTKSLIFLGIIFPILLFFGLSQVKAFLVIIVFVALILLNPGGYGAKVKAILYNVATFIISLFIAVILLEVYFHLAQPKYLGLHQGIFGDFSDYTRRGYFDKSIFNKRPNTFRILGVGDSFAVMLRDKQQNYHDIVQHKFKAKGDNWVEVVNAGVECTGPGYYYHMLKEYGDRFQPNLVLVGFFAGNDFNEMDFNQFITASIFEPRDTKARLLRYLHFENFWSYGLYQQHKVIRAQKREKEKELQKGEVKELGSFTRETFLHCERCNMWILEKNQRARFEELFRSKSQVLLDIRDWCAQRGIPLVIAIFPDNFQVDDELLADIIQKYHLSPDNLDVSYPNNYLYKFCLDHNIRCINMLDDFRKAAKTQKLYLLRDTHWNEEGNKLAGEIIFNYLEKQGLVKLN